MKSVYSIIISVLFISVSCSSESKKDSTVITLIGKNSNTVEDKIKTLQFFNLYPQFSVDISMETLYNSVNTIVHSINEEQRDIATFEDIQKAVEYQDKIKIYCLNMAIDGTRAVIALPIIQWKTKGKIYAAKLYEYTETFYDNIYPLNSTKDLFLMLGDTKGDGSCHFNYAYVIQLQNNKINLEYPAFGNRPYLNFCNGRFTFDEQEQVLHYQLNERLFENLEESLYWYDHYGKFKDDTIAGKKIFECIEEDYYEKCEFKLKFDGEIFI